MALTVSFGAKALGAILPWAAISFVPGASDLVHATSYLIAYAASVLLVVGAGVFDNLHLSNEIALDAKERGREFDTSDPTSSSSSSAPGSSDVLESAS